jgi:hypothetical protein
MATLRRSTALPFFRPEVRITHSTRRPYQSFIFPLKELSRGFTEPRGLSIRTRNEFVLKPPLYNWPIEPPS